MNKITTLAAISMFAVMMGMAAFSPAFATKSKVDICHFETVEDEFGEVIDSYWEIISISDNGNAVTAHTENHHDGEQYDFLYDEDPSLCDSLVSPPV